MAVAPELLEEGAAGAESGAADADEPGPFRAVSRASGGLRRAPAAARTAYGSVSSPSATAQTITKLLWAVAVGLIALEIAAEATGQHWAFNLPGIGRGPAPKQPYVPLYAGQPAFPGVMPQVGTPGLKLNPGTPGQ